MTRPNVPGSRLGSASAEGDAEGAALAAQVAALEGWQARARRHIARLDAELARGAADRTAVQRAQAAEAARQRRALEAVAAQLRAGLPAAEIEPGRVDPGFKALRQALAERQAAPIDAPMDAAAGARDSASAQPISAQTGPTTPTDPAAMVQSLAAVSAPRSVQVAGRRVVILAAPVLRLAQHLTAAAPEAALAELRDELTEVLTAVRQDPHQTLLLDLSALAATPEAYTLALAQREIVREALPKVAVPQVHPTLLVVAAHLLAQDPAATALAQELRARTLPAAAEAVPAADPRAAIDAVRALQAALTARDAELAKREADRAATRRSLEEARAATAAREAKRVAALQDLAGRDRRLAAQDTQIAMLEARVSQAEGNRVRAERHLAERDAALAQAQAEAEHLRQQLAEVHASTSWRVTEPMRSVRRRLRRDP